MKKISLAVLALMIMLSFSMAASADDLVKVKGTVTKIDATAKAITIKAKDGAESTVTMEDADMLAKVKEGDKAEVKYAVKDGKNVGSKVRKLTEGCQ